MSTSTSKQPLGYFQPKNLREIFALQLAQRLADEENLHAYVDLLRTYPVPFLLEVFAVAKEQSSTTDSLRERFWSVLGEDPEWRKND
jgi:hypothetical protein